MRLWFVSFATVMVLSANCGGNEHPQSAATTTAPVVAAAQVAPQPSYEYITFAPPDEVFDTTLNRLGGEGWQVVSTRRVRARGDMAYEVILRRLKREGQRATTAELETLTALRDAAKLHESDTVTVTASSPPSPPTRPEVYVDWVMKVGVRHVPGDACHGKNLYANSTYDEAEAIKMGFTIYEDCDAALAAAAYLPPRKTSGFGGVKRP